MISIVIPNKNGTRVQSTLESIGRSSAEDIEIIIVDASEEPTGSAIPASLAERTRLIRSDSRQLDAKILGSRSARGSFVLFLDADQTVSTGLLNELAQRREAAIYIPEEVNGDNLFSKLSQAKKDKVFRIVQRSLRDDIAAVPRYFSLELLQSAIARMVSTCYTKSLIQHEDSALYHFVLADILSQKLPVGFASNCIINEPITGAMLFRKSLGYGVASSLHAAALKSTNLNKNPAAMLGQKIDLRTPATWLEPPVSMRALCFDIARALPYGLGYALGRSHILNIKAVDRFRGTA